MKRMVSGAEEWIYAYTAGDERVWLKRVGFGLARWTLRDLEGKVLREYFQDTAGWSVASDYLYRDGQLLAAETPTGRKHFHLDHLGTPRLITNASGQKMAYHLYYPFGEEATAFNQDAERMKFTGHERDLVSLAGAGDDLDYMNDRHCSPVTGRFLSVDPASESMDARAPQSFNRYSYVRNSPLIYVDPTGEMLSFKGTALHFQQLAAMTNTGLFGQQLVIDSKGNASLQSTGEVGPPTPQQSALAGILRSIIEDSRQVTINVVSGDAKVLMGSYFLEAIDVRDIGALGKAQPPGQAATIAHEIVEQSVKQFYAHPNSEAGYRISHFFGVSAQDDVLGYNRGATVRNLAGNPLSGSTTTYFKKGPQSVVVTIDWLNGNVVGIKRF